MSFLKGFAKLLGFALIGIASIPVFSVLLVIVPTAILGYLVVMGYQDHKSAAR